jgi:hypothetical protein
MCGYSSGSDSGVFWLLDSAVNAPPGVDNLKPAGFGRQIGVVVVAGGYTRCLGAIKSVGLWVGFAPCGLWVPGSSPICRSSTDAAHRDGVPSNKMAALATSKNVMQLH